MHKFKTATRSAEKRQEAKEKLNEIFARVGARGKISPRGLKELHDERVDVAETIVELIQEDLNVVDPTPLLVEKRSQGINDKNIFQRLDGTLTVVNRSPGSKPLSQRLTANEFTFSTSMKEIAVEVPLEELVGGRITAAQVVEAMAFAIARYKVSLVLEAIDVAVTATADHTGAAGYNLRYAGFTDTNFEKAIDGLRDDGESPTIFGRHIALAPAMRGFTGWSEEATREFETRGQVASFLGAPVVTLMDKFSRLLGGHQIAADRAWVASSTKGAWLVESDVSFLNWALVDERTATFATGIRLVDGVFVHDKDKYRVITAS